MDIYLESNESIALHQQTKKRWKYWGKKKYKVVIIISFFHINTIYLAFNSGRRDWVMSSKKIIRAQKNNSKPF